MKAIIALLLITFASALSTNTKSIEVRRTIIDSYMNGSPKELFKVYHMIFEKPYDINSEIGLAKYKIFKKALEIVKTHNAKKLSWELEINIFADMTDEEKHQYTGLLPIPDDSNYKPLTSTPAQAQKEKTNSEMPDKIQRAYSNDLKKIEVFDALLGSDRRKLGGLSYFDQFADDDDLVQPKAKPVPKANSELNRLTSYNFTDIDHTEFLPEVKDQKSCGSCWAFSTAAAVEVRINKESKFIEKIRPTSTQQIVDCTNKGAYGCNGGWMHDAMRDLVGGINDEVDYVYEGVQGACRNSTKLTPHFLDNPSYEGCAWTSYFGKQVCTKQSWHEFLQKSALSVVLMAESNLFYYKSGIIDPASITTCNSYNHAVLAFNFKTDATTGNSVIGIRNSWGATWGDKGNAYYKYTDDGTCFITKFGIYPNIKTK